MSRRVMEDRIRPFGLRTPASPILPRNVFLQPYSTTSPWNTPIGSGAGANLVPAGLGAPPSTALKMHSDTIYMGMDPTAPTHALNTAHSTEKGPVASPYPIPAGTKVRVPASPISHAGQWNGIFAFLDQDNRHVWQGQPGYLNDGAVSTGNSPAWAFTYPQPPNLSDIYGSGLAGAHGGGHFGGLGGCLRAWEWYGTAPILHALALNVFSPKYLWSNHGDINTSGHRWPATKEDSGYTVAGGNNYYGGSVSAMTMGALLTFPDTYDATPSGLTAAGITDPNAQRIIWTLWAFGAYLVDASGVNEFYAFSVEDVAASDFVGASSAFHTQVMGEFTKLQVVNNNDATHIGGGGTPRAAAVSAVSP